GAAPSRTRVAVADADPRSADDAATDREDGFATFTTHPPLEVASERLGDGEREALHREHGGEQCELRRSIRKRLASPADEPGTERRVRAFEFACPRVRRLLRREREQRGSSREREHLEMVHLLETLAARRNRILEQLGRAVLRGARPRSAREHEHLADRAIA